MYLSIPMKIYVLPWIINTITSKHISRDSTNTLFATLSSLLTMWKICLQIVSFEFWIKRIILSSFKVTINPQSTFTLIDFLYIEVIVLLQVCAKILVQNNKIWCYNSKLYGGQTFYIISFLNYSRYKTH